MMITTPLLLGLCSERAVVLEPIFRVEVVTPEQYLGDVIGDLSRRRGLVEGQAPRGDAVFAITGRVPFGELTDYAKDLAALTQGQGSFTMEFASYEKDPRYPTDIRED